jgi:hypothetical protein
MSSEPDRVPDPGDAPRLAERCPALTSEILALAIQSGEHSLALAIHDLRFLGRCTCAPSCDRLLTAPYEQRSPYVAQLDPDEDIPTVWLGLSEDCETITDIQVMDAAQLGLPARAELRRLFHPLREGETWCAIPGLDKH